jgi:hypothetical protein
MSEITASNDRGTKWRLKAYQKTKNTDYRVPVAETLKSATASWSVIHWTVIHVTVE